MNRDATLPSNEEFSSTTSISTTATAGTEDSKPRTNFHAQFLEVFRSDVLWPMLNDGVASEIYVPVIQKSAKEFRMAEAGGARPKGDGFAIIVCDMAGRPAQVCKPGRPEPGKIHAEMRLSTGYKLVLAHKDSGARQAIAVYDVVAISPKEQGGYTGAENPDEEMFASAKLELISSGKSPGDFKNLTMLDEGIADAIISAVNAAARKMMTLECRHIFYGQLFENVSPDFGDAFRRGVISDVSIDEDEILIEKMMEFTAFPRIIREITDICNRETVRAYREERLKELGLIVTSYTSVAKETTIDDDGNQEERLVPYLMFGVFGRKNAQEPWFQLKLTDPISYSGLVDFLSETYGDYARVYIPKDVYSDETVVKKHSQQPFCRVLRFSGTEPGSIGSRR